MCFKFLDENFVRLAGRGENLLVGEDIFFLRGSGYRLASVEHVIDHRDMQGQCWVGHRTSGGECICSCW